MMSLSVLILTHIIPSLYRSGCVGGLQCGFVPAITLFSEVAIEHVVPILTSSIPLLVLLLSRFESVPSQSIYHKLGIGRFHLRQRA